MSCQKITPEELAQTIADSREIVQDREYCNTEFMAIVALADELTALRELNRELVEAGQACVSAWNSVCDSHGWERDHLAQFPALSALIAKARGEK